MKRASDNPQYRKFVGERDRALEKLLSNTQRAISDSLRAFLLRSVEIISAAYSLQSQSHGSMQISSLERVINDRVGGMVNHYAAEIYEYSTKLRRTAYTLSYAGEVEALSRAMHKSLKAELTSHDLSTIQHSKTGQGEDMLTRITLALNRIKRKMMDAVQLSIAMEETTPEMVERLLASLPKKRVVKVPRRTLKPVREADSLQDKKSLSLDANISDDAWDQMVQDYQAEYIPNNRSPESVFDIDIAEPELEETYGWEIEQQVTDDFVSKVTDGLIDAASENGVTEFIWVAIMDQKTDECCAWRDGLLLSEIKAQANDHADDDCEGDTPPLHFNCRCRIDPVSDDVKDKAIDENLEDFDDWLNS